MYTIFVGEKTFGKLGRFGRNLTEGWGVRKSDPVKFLARLLQGPWSSVQKTTGVLVTNTTHWFGLFCFTDFNETRQEYVNHVVHKWFHSNILKFLHFSPKQILGFDFANFGLKFKGQ